MQFPVLLGILLVAIWAYMSVWFGFAAYLKRVDAVDTAWGLGFIYLGLITFFSQSGYGWLQRWVLILVGIWGLRLATHITKRNLKKSEDARYVVYRQKWGREFWSRAYTNIYLMQGLLILVVSLPVIAVLSSPHASLNVLSILGLGVGAFGIVFEATADYQLRSFLRSSKGGIMQSGLWHYSRHPNYFGEITTWLGFGLVAVSVGRWWGLLGPTVIAFLIIKISGIPPLEKRYANDKAYQVYAKRTSVLIPLPPKP